MSTVTVLETIRGNGDLVALTDAQREQLCREIREFLIDSISRTGGHLASNLGVVELTVAIETVFNTYIDRLVFDVGHQSYVHKLLTGRQADFAQLRQFGGIAGFPKPAESNTDAFVAGHASSSVSIALGMARARTLLSQNYHVVALMGDGAATGGMAYEGLNDAAVSKEPLVIILNDNEMSIDRNVGGLARHLSRLRTKERYLGMKSRYRSVLSKLPGGKFIYRVTSRMKARLKRALLPGTMFEHMGLTYLGPVDGHDLPELIRVLKVAKGLNAPVLVHVLTNKGQGYKYAEDMPSKFHGVGRFDPVSGDVIGTGKSGFSDTFGKTMVKLAEDVPNLCAITAAMPGGTGLLEFQKQYPNRLFDVGIAEEHAVSMAGGLAKQGMIPVVALYSTFLQRAYDQILQDVAIQNLHVVFAVDRAGLVGEDGQTHHGVFDVDMLRQVPGMTLLCPASRTELQEMLTWAVMEGDGPIAIRYPRGGDRDFTKSDYSCGLVSCHTDGEDVTLITYGTMVSSCVQAASILLERGIGAKVLRLLQINPLPLEALLSEIRGNILIVEETCTNSGISHALRAEISEKFPSRRVLVRDLGADFVNHGKIEDLYAHLGLDANSIAEFVLEEHLYEN